MRNDRERTIEGVWWTPGEQERAYGTLVIEARRRRGSGVRGGDESAHSPADQQQQRAGSMPEAVPPPRLLEQRFGIGNMQSARRVRRRCGGHGP